MNLVPFGSVCELQNGRAFKPSEWSEIGTPIVRIQNLNDETKPFNYCDFEVEGRFHIQSGDLLFSWSGTPGTSFGAFFWNRGKAFLNQHIFRVDIDEKTVDKNYLRHAINSKLHHIIDQAHGGVGLKHITKGKLEAVEIYLPPLPEQKRIAAILDKADSLRRKNQQAIQLADKFLRAVFLDMFGDPVTNPKGWKKRSLEDVCSEVIDCPHSTPKWSDSGLICLRTSNLTKGDWNWDDKRFVSEETYKERTKRAELKANDIILSREGTVGIAALVPANETMCLGQRLVQLRVNRDILCPAYMLFLLLYELEPERISKVMAGSTSKHLNVKDLRNLAIATPPLEKQQAFSKVFLNIKNKQKQNSLSDYYGSELFNALSQKAFAGKL